MEAKDSMMSDKELEELLGEDFSTAYSGHIAEYRKIAEISFKAGIKTVVDWVEEHTHNIGDWTGWQEQKEDWDIDE